jgi:hypothetical protein
LKARKEFIGALISLLFLKPRSTRWNKRFSRAPSSCDPIVCLRGDALFDGSRDVDNINTIDQRQIEADIYLFHYSTRTLSSEFRDHSNREQTQAASWLRQAHLQELPLPY